MASLRGSDESFASLFEQTAGANARQRRYHPGESVEVTIVVVGRDAIFADLGGKQEGVFERTDLSDDEGKVRVEVGSRVTAVVDSVDFGTGQVRLRPVVIRAEGGDVGVARAQAQGDKGPVLVEGARIKGTVTGIERYGVFVQVAGTQGRSGRGLVPTVETATPRGADLKKHFTVGQDVEAKILSIEAATGKIRLSISALGADDERGVYEAFKSSQDAKAKPEAAPAEGGAQQSKQKPAPRGFGTLGDLLPKSLPEPKPAAPAAKKTAASPSVQPTRRKR
jgi:small subunit ribosomal protein S1